MSSGSESSKVSMENQDPDPETCPKKISYKTWDDFRKSLEYGKKSSQELMINMRITRFCSIIP